MRYSSNSENISNVIHDQMKIHLRKNNTFFEHILFLFFFIFLNIIFKLQIYFLYHFWYIYHIIFLKSRTLVYHTVKIIYLKIFLNALKSKQVKVPFWVQPNCIEFWYFEVHNVEVSDFSGNKKHCCCFRGKHLTISMIKTAVLM